MVERDYENAYKAHISRWGVGATLRGAREAGGETIAEASSASRIRAEYIHALENEDFAVLPGWAHALSYVRTYAEYLGLEPSPLVRRAREQIELRQHLAEPVRAATGGLRRWRAAAALVVVIAAAAGWHYTSPIATAAAMLEPLPRALKSLINRTFVAVADDDAAGKADPVRSAAAHSPAAPPAPAPAAGEVLGVDIAIEPTRPEPPAPAPETGTAPIPNATIARFAPLRDEPEAEARDRVVSELARPHAAIDRVAQPVADVILRARGPVWLTVEDADGRSLLARRVDEGALYRLPTGSGFTVTTDNAGAFEVYVEGALAGLMGPSGTGVTRLPVDRLTLRRADG